ncbi:hypothetical protein AYI69_g5828, partial [Smittium culicis]|jgi:kinesin family protein 5
MYNTQ